MHHHASRAHRPTHGQVLREHHPRHHCPHPGGLRGVRVQGNASQSAPSWTTCAPTILAPHRTTRATSCACRSPSPLASSDASPGVTTSGADQTPGRTHLALARRTRDHPGSTWWPRLTGWPELFPRRSHTGPAWRHAPGQVRAARGPPRAGWLIAARGNRLPFARSARHAEPPGCHPEPALLGVDADVARRRSLAPR